MNTQSLISANPAVVLRPVQAGTTPGGETGSRPQSYPPTMPADYPLFDDDVVLPGVPTDPIPNPEPEIPSLPDPDPEIYTPSDAAGELGQ